MVLYGEAATRQPLVIQKIDNVPHKPGDPAKELSGQSGEGAAWFTLVACGRLKEERSKRKHCET